MRGDILLITSASPGAKRQSRSRAGQGSARAVFARVGWLSAPRSGRSALTDAGVEGTSPLPLRASCRLAAATLSAAPAHGSTSRFFTSASIFWYVSSVIVSPVASFGRTLMTSSRNAVISSNSTLGRDSGAGCFSCSISRNTSPRISSEGDCWSFAQRLELVQLMLIELRSTWFVRNFACLARSAIKLLSSSIAIAPHLSEGAFTDGNAGFPEDSMQPPISQMQNTFPQSAPGSQQFPPRGGVSLSIRCKAPCPQWRYIRRKELHSIRYATRSATYFDSLFIAHRN